MLKFFVRYMLVYVNIKLCNKSVILKIVDYNMFFWNILIKDNIN